MGEPRATSSARRQRRRPTEPDSGSNERGGHPLQRFPGWPRPREKAPRGEPMRDRFDAIIADVTFALRQLRRSPVLAIAAILCFALGIGLNSAIFSVVNGVLIRPLPYRDADRIVVINEGLPKMNPGMGRISAAELVDYRELDGRVFQATAIYEPRSYTVRAPDGSLERVQGALVSGNFLRVLGREPALGGIPPTWLEN